MENPQGRILSIYPNDSPPHAVVEVAASIRCARCAAGKGCGAGLLGGDEKPRRVDALITHDLVLVEGDQVSIELAPNNLLRASLIVYGLPLLGALTGAAGAWLSGTGDLGAAIAALAGAGLGMLAGRLRLQRSTCLQAFTPVVTGHIAAAGD
jgi:sigma-E factor negative regulatory protein RseC